jgi:gas vesicle protein
LEDNLQERKWFTMLFDEIVGVFTGANRRKKNCQVATGVTLGLLGGALLGILFAPKSGEETRECIKDATVKGAEKVKEFAVEAGGVIKEKAQVVKEKIQEKYEKLGEDAEELKGKVSEKVADKAEEVAKKARATAREARVKEKEEEGE